MISLYATIAIVGATVHTGEGEALENATVIIEGTSWHESHAHALPAYWVQHWGSHYLHSR